MPSFSLILIYFKNAINNRWLVLVAWQSLKEIYGVHAKVKNCTGKWRNFCYSNFPFILIFFYLSLIPPPSFAYDNCMFYSIFQNNLTVELKNIEMLIYISNSNAYLLSLFFCEAVSPEITSILSIINSICSDILNKYPYLSFGFLGFPLYSAWEEYLNSKALFTIVTIIYIANGLGAK